MSSQIEAITIITKPAIFDDINNRTIIVVVFMLLGFGWLLYQSGLLLIWLEDEEYGHGMMVFGLLVYLLYHNRSLLLSSPISKSWVGIFFSLIALVVFLLGEISGIAPIQMYSIWFLALAATFSIGGWNLFRKLLIPMCIIFLLIPLPNVLGPMLTSQLQLVSSTLGVWIIRLFGGIVYLEGNVIDMGGVKLLVAEACAGLRYLFPLMSIGALAAYLMRAPSWMRWSLFLATIPVTIFMNSFRIGVTGLLTETYGSKHTEGFLHFFEGWVVFVTSLVILIGFAWMLIKSLPDSPPFSKVFTIENIINAEKNTQYNKNLNWQTQPAVLVMLSCLFIAVIASTSLIEHDSPIVASKPLSQFPQYLGEWRANESRLPVSIEDTAAASDYYYGTFHSQDNKKVNLYISYYEDQKQGPAPHSPTLCIPGDGWKITSDEPFLLKAKNGKTIEVSRLLIKKRDQTIVTYYWLKQGSKVFRQQYIARLDLIRFAMMENRADAALIRLVSEVNSDENIENADARMQQIASELLNVISEFIPD